jgi:hypothetical protein
MFRRSGYRFADKNMRKTQCPRLGLSKRSLAPIARTAEIMQ